MSEKQTFIDPKTGEEIESTGLARWGAWGIGGIILGLGGGGLLGLIGQWFIEHHRLAFFLGALLSFGLFVGVFMVFLVGLLHNCRWAHGIMGVCGGLWLGIGLLSGDYATTGLGLVSLVAAILGHRQHPPDVRENLWGRQWHDRLARWQHERQKRKLTEQEWAGIPDGSLQKPHLQEEADERAVSVADIQDGANDA